jgi:hypothetical protein
MAAARIQEPHRFRQRESAYKEVYLDLAAFWRVNGVVEVEIAL